VLVRLVMLVAAQKLAVFADAKAQAKDAVCTLRARVCSVSFRAVGSLSGARALETNGQQ